MLYHVFSVRQMSSHWVNLSDTHSSLTLYSLPLVKKYAKPWSAILVNVFCYSHFFQSILCSPFFFWLKSFILQVIYLIKQLLSCNFSVKNLQCDRAEERGWLKIKHYQVKAHATSCVSYSAILWSLIFSKEKPFSYFVATTRACNFWLHSAPNS